jgi:hypothetical protein
MFKRCITEAVNSMEVEQRASNRQVAQSRMIGKKKAP